MKFWEVEGKTTFFLSLKNIENIFGGYQNSE
jgi:hypothetical protein